MWLKLKIKIYLRKLTIWNRNSWAINLYIFWNIMDRIWASMGLEWYQLGMELILLCRGINLEILFIFILKINMEIIRVILCILREVSCQLRTEIGIRRIKARMHWMIIRSWNKKMQCCKSWRIKLNLSEIKWMLMISIRDKILGNGVRIVFQTIWVFLL